MKLECYALVPQPPKLVPADPSREWMDEFPSRHAYRCLPLAIANTYGWDVLSPATFAIDWNGGKAAGDITFAALDTYPYLDHLLASNFTHGIVTFHTGYLFRTEPNWSLFASGPLNRPKDGISPLTGIVETDWLPYPFTMNWQLTRPGSVVFEKDEPICTVFPVPRAQLEIVQPEIRNLGDNSDLEKQYWAWRKHREQFMSSFKSGDPETLKQAWQRFYFLGQYPDGKPTESDHKNKVRLNAPVDRRGKP